MASEEQGLYRDKNGSNVVRLLLPFPPSANTYWRHYRGHTTRSKEAKDYIALCSQWIQAQVMPKDYNSIDSFSNLQLEVAVYFNVPNRGDLDNRIKVMQDALADALDFNDSEVRKIVAVRRYDKHWPRVQLKIEHMQDSAEDNDTFQSYLKRSFVRQIRPT